MRLTRGSLPGAEHLRGTPDEPEVEAGRRDAALFRLEATRSSLVAIASRIAMEVFREAGEVTSVEVFKRMRAEGHGAEIDAADPRWMGAVFRQNRGWRRKGMANTGSHKRPVSIWVRDTSGE